MADIISFTQGGTDYELDYPTSIGGTVSHKLVVERRKSSDSATVRSVMGVVEQIQVQGIVEQLEDAGTTPGINEWINSLARSKNWWTPTNVTLTYTETDLHNPSSDSTITYNGCIKDFKAAKLEYEPAYEVNITFFRHKSSTGETERAMNMTKGNLKLTRGSTDVYFDKVFQSSVSVTFPSMIQLPQRTSGKCRVINNLSASEKLTFKGKTNSFATIVNYINNMYVTNWWTASNVSLEYTDWLTSDTYTADVLLNSFSWEHNTREKGVYNFDLEFTREK